jgi:MarR family transcriptional regulator, transcriptional regulator for hemolysin
MDEVRLGRQLAMALKAVRAHLDEQLRAEGSSFHSWLVLGRIDAHPGLSQRALASRLGIEGPTLTHHLDRLAADGLVERVRSREDRRVWCAGLTPAGRAHLDSVAGAADRVDSEVRSLFSDAEWRTLSSCLDRIIETYRRQRVDHDDTLGR